MVLRWIFSKLLNNERFVNNLAESYPIRRAAQLSVYLYHVGRSAMANPRFSESIGKWQAQLKDARDELKKKAEK